MPDFRPSLPMPGTITSWRVSGLVHRIARHDRAAFRRLHRMLAPVVTAQLRAAPLRHDEVEAIAAATFMEVWWLARFRRDADTDVCAWITDVAARRTRDRLEVPRHHPPDGDDRLGTGGHRDVELHDQQMCHLLATLLRRAG